MQIKKQKNKTKPNKSNNTQISIRKWDGTRIRMFVYVYIYIYINTNGLCVYFSKVIISYIHVSHSDFIFMCTRSYNKFA